MNFDPLAFRVAVAYLKRAGWQYLNSTYTNISYSPQKWRVEEMASGEPIPSSRNFGEDGPSMHVYELPGLEQYVKKKTDSLRGVTLSPEVVRQYAHLHGDDKGPVIRQKIIDGHKTLFHEIEKSLKEDQQTEVLSAFHKLLPELERKLVWKKVK
jgi:hypothetical protein